MLRLLRIRRRFPRPRVQDIADTVRRQLAEPLAAVRPGTEIAVAVGSRGIANLAAIVSATVAMLKEAGAKPFLVPAMGSHGGATAEGQREVLES